MKNLGLFLQEVRAELSKVVWPSRDEFWGSVVVVVVTMIAFAIFLGLINYVFKHGAFRGLEFFVFGR